MHIIIAEYFIKDVFLGVKGESPEEAQLLAMPSDHRLVELCTALLTTPGVSTSLAQWAERLGMSERNLARLFRRETGTSFRTWRLFYRFVSRTVFTYTECVVCPDEFDGKFHQGSHTYGGFHVV